MYGNRCACTSVPPLDVQGVGEKIVRADVRRGCAHQQPATDAPVATLHRGGQNRCSDRLSVLTLTADCPPGHTAVPVLIAERITTEVAYLKRTRLTHVSTLARMTILDE